MTQKLKTYFPDIRQREELLEQIHGNIALEQIFNAWNPEQQNLFLDCCTGVFGCSMTRFLKSSWIPTPYRNGWRNCCPFSWARTCGF